MAAFAAVSCLIETLEDLLRFTFLALEINKLQIKIEAKQSPEDFIRDSVKNVAEKMLRFWMPMISKYLKHTSTFHFLHQEDDESMPTLTLKNEGKQPADNPIWHFVHSSAGKMWKCWKPHPNRKCSSNESTSLLKQSRFLLKVRAKEISNLCQVLSFLLTILKDLATICPDREKMQYLEGIVLNTTYSIEDTVEETLFDRSIFSKAFNFIHDVINEDPRSVMGEVSFMTQILEMFDKRCGIQPHLRQALKEIHLIMKEEVRKIYVDAPSVIIDLQLRQNSGIGDSLQYMFTKKKQVFDIDDDFLLVLDRVIRDASPLELVAIVGMGGIGKTTLAQNLFDYPLTCHHFYIRAWVAVSQVYQVRDILLGLLRCINQIKDEIYGKSNGQLAEELYRSLKGKRFFIVLDNVWSPKAWDDIKRCFPDDKNGSRIVLTTRLRTVADYVNPKQPPHFVNLLDTDKSWMLLQKKVFAEEPCPLELEDVGRRIARKCKGLPLVIVAIAGILCKITRTSESWEGIARSVSSVVSSDPEQCLEILALSFNQLPNHLKACFLYMGAFPEDCEIEAKKLIRLWISEGFLDKKLSLSLVDVKHFLFHDMYEYDSDEVSVDRAAAPEFSGKLQERYTIHFPLLRRSISSLEVEAETYLQDLIDRNLVLAGKRSFSGKIKTCRLHEIVQDLCIREAQKEKFLHVIRRDSEAHSAGILNPRRLGVHSNFWFQLHSSPPMKLVRSFLCFSLGFGSMSDTIFFQLGFKLLRVLDIIFLHFQSFPVQILQLVHLRYLAFTATYELPISISELKNLRTLVIHGPWIQDEFGDSPILLLEYWNMPWLRHLHTTVPCYLRNPFIADKDLCIALRPQYLQSLSAIMFSSCSQEVFSLMPHLKKLGIFESEEDYRTDVSSKWLRNLVHLNQLEALKCSFYGQNKSPIRNNLRWLLPSSLKKLSLSWSYLPWENMTPVAMLPNLEVLKLKNHAFQGQEWEPSEEGFRCLKHLLIENHDIVHLEATRINFPCLEHLALRSCKFLEEVPIGIVEIPTLQQIELHYCSESAEIFAKQIEEQIDGPIFDIRSDRG